jgi:mannosyltransferase OCH1-like enzyme
MAKIIPYDFLFFIFNKNKRQQTNSRKGKLYETVSRETHVFTCVE